MAKAAGPDGTLKRSFPPVVDAATRILVLGSLPGERSLAEQRYYANPRNHFWHLTGAVIERDLVALDYEHRLATLLSCGIGLWDVVQSAARTGSLDANIRGHTPNQLAALAARLPALTAVAFNGSTSAAIGTRELGDAPGIALVPLPSSSPAYTLALAEKRERWLQLRRWL